MKTRISKIAQLPKSIRDQLNRRLENGHQSPELLQWLNDLPQTKKLLAKKFDNQPISKSNLSNWRHGGFQEWRADQARQAHIRRISESGTSLEKAETGDLFENFARIAVAELMADLDSLQNLRGEKRSQYLHSLIRDLARLQNSYNRSRWAALAWYKYNDRDSGTAVPPVRSKPETRNSKPEIIAPETQILSPDRSTTVALDCTQSQAGTPHDSNHEPTPGSGHDVVHFTRCDCHDPCPKCHAPDSDYPLDEAIRDREFHKKYGRYPHDRHGNLKCFVNCDCDCFCDRCAEKRAANPPPVAQAFQPAGSGDFPVPGPCSAEPSPTPSPKNQTAIPPFDPTADFLRQMSLLKSRSK